MVNEVEILDDNIGKFFAYNKVVLRGKCPYCEDWTTFKQLSMEIESSKLTGFTIPIQCDGCRSVGAYSLEQKRFYPSPKIKGIEKLPSEIDKYYQEGLRCISVDSPNGAVTLFRKVIHALGIHYGIAKANDDKKLYEIINALHEKGHIVKKLRDILLGIKDIGNDGAHINENEPDIEQAKKIKQLIDVTLNSTVVSDSNLIFVNKKHKE